MYHNLTATMTHARTHTHTHTHPRARFTVCVHGVCMFAVQYTFRKGIVLEKSKPVVFHNDSHMNKHITARLLISDQSSLLNMSLCAVITVWFFFILRYFFQHCSFCCHKKIVMFYFSELCMLKTFSILPDIFEHFNVSFGLVGCDAMQTCPHCVTVQKTNTDWHLHHREYLWCQ
jgi:hypothetical protein